MLWIGIVKKKNYKFYNHTHQDKMHPATSIVQGLYYDHLLLLVLSENSLF